MLAFEKVFINDQQEYNGGYNCADHIGKRLCIKGCGSLKKSRQSNGSYDVQGLSENGQGKSCLGTFQGGQRVHKYILEAQRNHHHGKDPDSPYRKVNILRIGSEKQYKDFWEELGQDEHACCKAKHQLQNGTDRFFYPFGCLSAVIVTDYCLGTAADADHRSGDHQHITLDNGGAGDQHISLLRTAVFLKDGIHNDKENAVGCQDQER